MSGQPERRGNDGGLYQTLGEIHGEMKGMRRALDNLPCRDHDKAIASNSAKIAANTAKTGTIGAISGLIAGLLTALGITSTGN